MVAAGIHLREHRESVNLKDIDQYYRDAVATARIVEEATAVPRFWTHSQSIGGRTLELFDGSAEPFTVDDDPFGQWEGFNPFDVSYALYESASSGSQIEFVRDVWTEEDGFLPVGTLAFYPPTDDPAYRGAYYRAVKDAPAINQ